MRKFSNRDFRKLMKKSFDRKISREMRKMNMDKIDRKYGNHPFLTEKEVKSLSKKEKVAKFITAVYRQDNTIIKALAGGVPADGGFQVPEEWLAEVNRIIEDFGLVRRLARKIPMKTDTMHIPRLASSVGVSFPGENSAGTPTQPVWEEVKLLASTAVGLTVSSNELLADANIDVVNLLSELFAEALAGEEDFQGLRGTGAPFTGILNAVDIQEVVMTTGNTSYVDATPDDFRDLQAQVKPWSLQNAAYFMHRSVWSEIQKKKASTGEFFISTANPILNPIVGEAGTPKGPNAGIIVGTLWGFPVFLSEKLPTTADGSQAATTFAIFGNLQHLYFGDRQQMTFDISNSAVVGTDSTFEKNQSAVRMTERFSIEVGLPKAFARLKTATT